MTTLLQQIEEMRVQVNELSNGEQKLLEGLNEALTRADHQLLHEVRQVMVEHDRRRGMILKELQALALSIGSFPGRREPIATLAPTPADPSSFLSSHAEDQFNGRGEWRHAAGDIQDELDFQLNGRAAKH
jgi:hypothetical protein